MKEKIKEIFFAAGIKDIGFCSIKSLQNKFIECRAKSRLPENAKSVIVCLFPYKVNEAPPENISRYAAVPDYHIVCGRYLQQIKEELSEGFPCNRFEYFIDNSPIPEVSAAVSAGLGKRGDNGLLINKTYGSFVFIGEIVTDLYIECEENYAECSHCGKCVAACEVGCDKSRCLSAISQKKGELTPQETDALKRNNILWGCDICAHICPENEGAEKTYIKEFIEGYRNAYKKGENPEQRAYNWRKGAIQRNFNLINE